MPVTKKRPLVVLTDYSYETIQPFIDVYKAADFEFRPCQCKSPEEIIEACKDADAIQVHFAEITRDILAALPKCRLLVHSGVGMDTIDVDAARDLASRRATCRTTASRMWRHTPFCSCSP